MQDLEQIQNEEDREKYCETKKDANRVAYMVTRDSGEGGFMP